MSLNITAGDLVHAARTVEDQDSPEMMLAMAHRAMVREGGTDLSGFDEWLDSVPMGEIPALVAQVAQAMEVGSDTDNPT
jgi:hypothetical protein